MTNAQNSGAVEAVGPQFRRVEWTCQGCKHLTTHDWVEYPDGERDSGTIAWCNASGEKRNLSAYWSPHHQPPSSCPFPVPTISTTPAPSDQAGLIEAFQNLRTTAVLLLNNSEGCAANHYCGDMQVFGMPQWLVDCRADIELATSVIASAKPTAPTLTAGEGGVS